MTTPAPAPSAGVEYVLSVPGLPAPKGSMKCVGGRGRHQLIEDNPRTKPWREHVAQQARRTLTDHGRTFPKGAAVRAIVTFTVPRPKSNHDPHPVTRGTGDVDKLLRLILDALQDAGVLHDDSAVIDVRTRKGYPCPDATTEPTPQDRDVKPWPGVVIRLRHVPA